jgi:nitrogen fixation NifU-like protein
MSELRELYQEVILDHARHPRGYGTLESATHRAQGYNPLCGDQLELALVLDADGRVREVRFRGKGCAISTASASLLTEAVAGLTVAEVGALFERFHAAVTTPADEPLDVSQLGKLAALTGVREFPMRVKCASLAWHALQAALRGDVEPITTE